MSHGDDEHVRSARIHSDIERADRILGPLTAQQTAILATTALVLYGGFWAARAVMTPLAYLALTTPIAAVMAVIAVGGRDGISMDRFLIAALRFHRMPKQQVYAPEGVPPLPRATPAAWRQQAGPPPAALRLPCEQVIEPGVLDLGRDGRAALAVCGTLNFALRTGTEQQAVTEAFARWLNSLTGPAQILVRAHRLDVRPLVDELEQNAYGLPHPALERAAQGHAAFLRQLAAQRDLLTRQVVLSAREPTASGATRAVHRISEAAQLLHAAEITVSPLDAPATAEALHIAADPDATSLGGV